MISPRVGRLQESIAARGLDAFLVSNTSNCRYLSGYTGDSAWLLVTADSVSIAVDSRFWEQVKRDCPDWELIPIRTHMNDWFLKAAAKTSATRWGIEGQSVTVAAYQGLTEQISKENSTIQLVPATGIVESLRAVKDSGEITIIEKACNLADLVFQHARAKLAAGMTERQLAWELESFLRLHGSESVPFDIIIASGPNAALPHAHPSDRQIGSGEPVIIDLGARVDGYCSDFTRTICAGEPDPTLVKVHGIVLGSQLTALATIQPGMTGEQADSLARTVINQAGYEQAFGHGLGHGVGLDIHEMPRVGMRSPDTLAENMVFTIEPGIYLPGWGGVRIEDTVVMEASGVRRLTGADKAVGA